MKYLSMILVTLFFGMALVACGAEVGENENPTDNKNNNKTSVTSKETPAQQGEVCFQRDILPLFVSSCAKSGCHSAKDRKEGIDMSSYAAIIGSKGGRGIVPSNPSGSKIFRSLTASGEDLMPPGKPLPSAQIALIEQWIKEGAKNTSCEATGSCNTKNITYTKTIQPILQKYCVGCHGTSSALGGLRLHTYALAKTAVLAGKMIPSIAREAGAKPMPPGKAVLPSCEVSQIKQWLKDGTPQ